MAIKKVSELTYDDLGKEASLIEANGDINSGKLESASYHRNSIIVKIGNAQLSGLDPDDTVDLTD